MNAKTKSAAAKLPTNRTILFFIVLLAAGMIGAIINAYIVLRDAGHDAQYLELTGELRILSQQIATSSRQATAGDADAFKALEKSRADFNSTLTALLNGKPAEGLPSPQAMLGSELSALGQTWAQVNTSAETIVKNRQRILFLHEVAKTLNESIPELQEEYNNVVEILIDNRAPADQISVAQRQSWLAERIARNVDKMLQGGEAAKAAADQFNLDASLFGSVLDGMLKGNRVMGIRRVTDAEAKESLDGISQLFEFVSGSVDEIFQASPDLLLARQAADKIVVESPRMMDQTTRLAERISGLEGERKVTTTTALGFVALVIWHRYPKLP